MNDSYIGTIEIINNNNDYNSVLNINSQNNLMKFILKRIRNVQVHVMYNNILYVNFYVLFFCLLN